MKSNVAPVARPAGTGHCRGASRGQGFTPVAYQQEKDDPAQKHQGIPDRVAQADARGWADMRWRGGWDHEVGGCDKRDETHLIIDGGTTVVQTIIVRTSERSE